MAFLFLFLPIGRCGPIRGSLHGDLGCAGEQRAPEEPLKEDTLSGTPCYPLVGLMDAQKMIFFD